MRKLLQILVIATFFVVSSFAYATEGDPVYEGIPFETYLSGPTGNFTSAVTTSGYFSGGWHTGTTAYFSSGATIPTIYGNTIISDTITFPSQGLHILDLDASHDLILTTGSNLNQDRTFTINPGNNTLIFALDGNLTFSTGGIARTFNVNGDPTLNDWFDQSVKTSANPTFNTLKLSSWMSGTSAYFTSGVTDNSLTASRLVSSGTGKRLQSTNMTSWLAGTANQVTIGDDGDGSVTASLPSTLILPGWVSGTTGNFSSGVTIGALLNISGASAGQLKFPASQNASSDANTLDDYEEGTWTVAVTMGTSGTVSLYANLNEGSYTKIGNLVHVSGQIRIETISSPVGDVRFSLPFAVANLADSSAATSGSIATSGIDIAANCVSLCAYVGETLSIFYIHEIIDDGSWSYIQGSAIANGDYIRFGFSYKTST